MKKIITKNQNNWFFITYENMQMILAYVEASKPCKVRFVNTSWQQFDEVISQNTKEAKLKLKTLGFQKCLEHKGFLKLWRIPDSISNEDWYKEAIYSLEWYKS